MARAISIIGIVLLTVVSAPAQTIKGGICGSGCSMGPACAPPNYCTVQGLAVIQPDPASTALSGVTGAGTCYIPIDFGKPICRLTDANWDPAIAQSGFNNLDNEVHAIACNNGFVFFSSTGGLGYPAALNLSNSLPYMSISHLYPTGSDSAHGGWYINSTAASWSWDCVNHPNTLFILDPTNAVTIDAYDFTGYAGSPSGSPALTTKFNYAAGATGSWGTTSANCLPSTANFLPGFNEFFGSNKNPGDAYFLIDVSLVIGINLGVDTITVTAGSKNFTVTGPTALDTTGTLTNAFININGLANYTYAIATVAGGGFGGTLTTAWAGSNGTYSLAIPDDQGTGQDIAVYRPGFGCARLNTASGTITSDWGTSGTVTTTDRIYIHGARVTPDGSWVFISTDGCVPGTCSSVNNMGYIWQIGTLNLAPLCVNPNNCGGHNEDGYLHIFNNGAGIPVVLERPYAGAPASFTTIGTALNTTNCNPPTGPGQADTHATWLSVDPLDSSAIFWSSTALGTNQQIPGSYNCPLMDEIYGVAANATLYRFAHTLITGANWSYAAMNGLHHVSADGYYDMFTSDWSNTSGVGSLGQYNKTAGTCVNTPVGNTACRPDLFMVKLAP